MAKKKRRKRRPRIAPGSSNEPATPEERRKKFPKALVEAFIAVSNDRWEDEDLYQVYVEHAQKYLGKKKFADRIESGRLIVLLARATMDIREKKKTTKSKVVTKKGDK